MKKIILIAAAAFASMASFANVDPVTGKVLEAFRASFADAKNVQWKSLDESGLFQATFNYQNSELSAFYSEDGEMVAVARYINKANLPIMVSKEINERYPDHAIQTVIERIANGSTTYHVTLNSPKSSLVVAVSPSGDFSVSKKIKHKL
ncbi:hypothetical protein [Flavihumibacter fluvii]|uniref:hypothetical protein n=1 Tax=Flavihumibacter fluvii TaxID=2838157 RepID=UPI001BDF443C|nr:hypothetical protein [Flavihumibacter fluvii]ULQ51850.1 hypothetical protein KJS93_17315 [Flavihumibacter fluvii]